MPLLNESNTERKILFNKEVVLFSFDGILKAGVYEKVKLLDDIEIINGRSKNNFSILGNFKWTQETVDKEVENGTVFVIKSKKISPRYIRQGERIKRPADIISKIECCVETNEAAKKRIRNDSKK